MKKYYPIISAIMILSIGIFVMPKEAQAAIAFVQSTTGSAATTPTVTTNFAGAVTAGNLIVLTVGDDSGITGQITSISDTGGNTYHQIFQYAGVSTLTMYYADNITGGANFAVTVNWSEDACARVVVIAQEFSGIGATPLDKNTTGAEGTGTAAASGNTAATTQADELVVGSAVHGGTTSAFSLGAGYTNLGTVNVANAATGQQSKIVSATGVQASSMTIAASKDWVAGVATFKGTASGTSAGSIPSFFVQDTSFIIQDGNLVIYN